MPSFVFGKTKDRVMKKLVTKYIVGKLCIMRQIFSAICTDLSTCRFRPITCLFFFLGFYIALPTRVCFECCKNPC